VRMANEELVRVLRESIWRERERIKRAEAENMKLELELLELGVEVFSEG